MNHDALLLRGYRARARQLYFGRNGGYGGWLHDVFAASANYGNQTDILLPVETVCGSYDPIGALRLLQYNRTNCLANKKGDLSYL